MSAFPKIPTGPLGKNGPDLPKLGFGTMGIGAYYGKSSADEDTIMQTLSHAADIGMNFWDTSDIYGTSEATLGKWFEKTGRRNEIFLATKFGAYDLSGPPERGVTSRPSYVRQAVVRSLQQLKTNHIDLYYQHRVDPKVPIEIVLETLREFVESGKIRYLGLSECSIDTLRRAKKVPGLGEKLIAVQVEYSPFTLDIERPGPNGEKSFAAQCEELGVSIVAYSPLARGLVTGRYRSRNDFDQDDLRLILPRWSEENFPKNLLIVDKIKEIADKNGATPSQVTLAWILAEHPSWFPIPGCRTVPRLEENARSTHLKLSPEAVREIRELVENAEVAGTRNRTLSWIKAGVEGNCIPLEAWKGEENM